MSGVFSFPSNASLNAAATLSVTVKRVMGYKISNCRYSINGSFTLTKTDLDTNKNSDSKPDGYIGLYRIFHIVQTQTRIPTPYFCTGQESELESVPESTGCGNVNDE